MTKGMEKGQQTERHAIAKQLLDALEDVTVTAKTGLSQAEVLRCMWH